MPAKDFSAREDVRRVIGIQLRIANHLRPRQIFFGEQASQVLGERELAKIFRVIVQESFHVIEKLKLLKRSERGEV